VAEGALQLDSAMPLDDKNPQSLRLTVTRLGRRCGVANPRRGEMNFQSGEWYDVTFHARTEDNKRVGLVFSIESTDGVRVCACTTIPEVGGDWKQYTLSLHARASESKGRVVITPIEPCVIWLNNVSLSPRTTIKDQSSGPRPDQSPIVSRGVRVHDPSTMVKCKDDYWLFYTGRGVPSYHSKDLIKWESGPRVFTNALAWVTNAVPGNRGGMDFWAPDIIHFGNQYLLYYSASTFGKNISAIGLATNPTLDPGDPQYQWTDHGLVVQSGEYDDFNTIDPAITQDAGGGLWLAFGSFWSGIKLIQLDPATGKRIAPDSPIYSLAHYNSIEAPYIYPHGNHYYLFVNWGLCCRGANSSYEIRVGRSDGITGPYLDQNGVDLLHGGGSLFLATNGRFIGPGHAGIISEGGTNWFSCHFYDGERNGMSALGMGQVQWDADGWPVLLPAK
jgi:arabinan endo-1,5-alpha-L-arabinosidase